MKKIIFLITLASFIAAAAQDLKPEGTFGNLLSNGKLELLNGSFPRSWHYIGVNRPDYAADGGFNNGPRFIFTKKNVKTTVMQNWTFSIAPGEKYRFRAKIRGRKFRAAAAIFMVLNNGLTKSVRARIPQGVYDWQDFAFAFTGFESQGGYYAVAIIVNQQRAGALDISEIAVEGVTESAYKKRSACRKVVPMVKANAISPRGSAMPGNDSGAAAPEPSVKR